MASQGQNIRYSSAFKQKVITEIESGIYTILEAQRVYGVSDMSIYKWLRQYGKDHLINKTVRVEMRGEADRIKELEKEKQKLESALAQAHLRIMVLESTMECAEEKYNIDFKKKSGTRAPVKASLKGKNRR